jgi:hypothetical protein
MREWDKASLDRDLVEIQQQRRTLPWGRPEFFGLKYGREI